MFMTPCTQKNLKATYFVRTARKCTDKISQILMYILNGSKREQQRSGELNESFLIHFHPSGFFYPQNRQ